MKKLLFLLFLLFSSNAYTLDQKLDSYVTELINNTFKIIDNKNLSQQQKIEQSQNLMRKNLDFELMSKYSLGRNKKNISESEYQKFKSIYIEYVVKTYAEKTRLYNGEKIKILKTIPIGNQGEEKFAVKTSISNEENNKTLQVDFIIRKVTEAGKEKFLIFDMVTENVSLLNAQRSEFASIIASEGIESLTKILIEKSKTSY